MTWSCVLAGMAGGLIVVLAFVVVAWWVTHEGGI